MNIGLLNTIWEPNGENKEKYILRSKKIRHVEFIKQGIDYIEMKNIRNVRTSKAASYVLMNRHNVIFAHTGQLMIKM